MTVNQTPRSTRFAYIYALKFHEGRLYVGGKFDEISGIKASGVASFNGTSWDP